MKKYLFFCILLCLPTYSYSKKKNFENKAFDILYTIDTTLYSLTDEKVDTISFEIKIGSLENEISKLKERYDPNFIKLINLDSLKIVFSIGKNFGKNLEYKNLKLSGIIDFDVTILNALKTYIDGVNFFIESYIAFCKNGLVHSGIVNIELTEGINEYSIDFQRTGIINTNFIVTAKKNLLIYKVIQPGVDNDIEYFPEFLQEGKKYLLKNLLIKMGEFETTYEINYIELKGFKLPVTVLKTSKSYNANVTELFRFINHNIVKTGKNK